MNQRRFYLVTAAILGFLAVAFGAFGAHALDEVIADKKSTYELANRYHFYHTFAILALGLLSQLRPGLQLKLHYYSFLGGTIVFSGSLYLLAITKVGWLGAITPIGGTLLLIGWVLLGWSVLKRE